MSAIFKCGQCHIVIEVRRPNNNIKCPWCNQDLTEYLNFEKIITDIEKLISQHQYTMTPAELEDLWNRS